MFERSRPPAELSIKPGRADYTPYSGRWLNEIQKLINSSGEVFFRNTTSDSPCGYYRIESDDEPLFLKIVPSCETPQLDQAEAIAKYLHQKGVPALHHLQKHSFPNDHNLYSYPWLNIRPYKGTDAQDRDLARTLALLHNHNNSFPDSRNIIEHTESLQEKLNQQRDRILSGDINLPHADLLMPFLKSTELSFPTEDYEFSHGDIHQGNLLFSRERNCVLVDFEKSMHSYFPKGYDLFCAILRFILVDNKREQDKTARRFVTYYLEDCQNPNPLPNDLFNLGQWMLARCFILISLYSKDMTGLDKEWAKHISLLKILRKNHHLLRELKS